MLPRENQIEPLSSTSWTVALRRPNCELRHRHVRVLRVAWLSCRVAKHIGHKERACCQAALPSPRIERLTASCRQGTGRPDRQKCGEVHLRPESLCDVIDPIARFNDRRAIGHHMWFRVSPKMVTPDTTGDIARLLGLPPRCAGVAGVAVRV